MDIARRQIEVNVHRSMVDDTLAVRREYPGFDAKAHELDT